MPNPRNRRIDNLPTWVIQINGFAIVNVDLIFQIHEHHPNMSEHIQIITIAINHHSDNDE